MPKLILILSLVLLPLLNVSAEESVIQFRGTDSDVSREFEVKAPWILRWRVGSDYPRSMGFELSLIDAVTRYQHSRIMKLKSTGSGTKLFSESGRFRFSISATLADWDLRVIELSQAEADELVRVKRPGEEMIRKR